MNKFSLLNAWSYSTSIAYEHNLFICSEGNDSYSIFLHFPFHFNFDFRDVRYICWINLSSSFSSFTWKDSLQDLMCWNGNCIGRSVHLIHCTFIPKCHWCVWDAKFIEKVSAFVSFVSLLGGCHRLWNKYFEHRFIRVSLWVSFIAFCL